MAREEPLVPESIAESGGFIAPNFADALATLRRAWHYASDTGRDRWDFAVELASLEGYGLTPTDLRWLICKGYLRHASELTEPGAGGRCFREHHGLSFEGRACFILTETGLDFANALLSTPELCDRVERAHPLRGLGTDDSRRAGTLRPHWNCDSRELRYLGHLVKQFKVPSPNQEVVIMSFEEEGWPTCIDDPLPLHSERDPKQRLHDTIRSLNRNQKARLLRFKGNGTGEGVIWEPVNEALACD